MCILNWTRMHSSRMRTGRSLTVCWSLLPGGGGLPGWGGSPLSRGEGGSPWSGGRVSLVWGGSPCLVRGGSPCLIRGGLPAWSGEGGGWQSPPPVNRITDTCKNITLATTSLRPVIIYNYCSREWKSTLRSNRIAYLEKVKWVSFGTLQATWTSFHFMKFLTKDVKI